VKYNSKEKTALTKKYDLPKSSDSCAIFAAAILEKLKPNGTVGLLLPEAFFNISSYRKIRQRLLNSKIMSIKNHGRAFDGLLTKAQEIVFEKRLSNNSQKVLCDFDGENYWREQSDFANNPNQIFNFYCDDIDAKIIAHLFRHPHQTLKNKAKWALGIVTGGNNTHLLKAPIDGAVPIFKGNDITGEGFKDPTNWIAPDFDKFQQSAPRDLYEAPEKIAYRFISSQLCFAYDNEKRLFLNSANMLIPSNELGISAANLTKLLNTSLLRWLFAKIFNTPKILRGDLETLPLFVEQFKAANFVENEGFYDSLGILEHLNRINPHPSAPAQRPSR
jgi:site-specific DNA-methyltransferase (adenine-specific)